MEAPGASNAVTEAAIRSMHDIVLPSPPSWMPQTWGWVLVAFIVLLTITILGLIWRRRRNANAYRREALRLLMDIEHDIVDPATRAQAVIALAAVLKRTALAAFPRRQVAALSGKEWVSFLDEQDDDDTGHAVERLLDDAEYRGRNSLERLPENVGLDLTAGARSWIERHHVRA